MIRSDVPRPDLLLGSDIGLWVAEHVDPLQVRRVVTSDSEIAAVARARGLDVRDAVPAAISEGSAPGGLALSVHYPDILTTEQLTGYRAAYNLHPGLLPWGRGHFPLVWAIWQGEPAGATLHRITTRLDGGPVVDQVPVPVRSDDTGGSLHARLRAAERDLFTLWWPRLVAGESLPERAQDPGGSYHDRHAFTVLLATDPDALDAASEARLRRALTFPGKPGLAPRRRERRDAAARLPTVV